MLTKLHSFLSSEAILFLGRNVHDVSACKCFFYGTRVRANGFRIDAFLASVMLCDLRKWKSLGA